MAAFAGYDNAVRAIDANKPSRMQRLEGLVRWVEGTQYDDLPCGWFDDKVPLWERRPCIVYPAAAIAIESYVDLIFGENRFPTFTAKPAEAEGELEGGLNEEDSARLDRFIAELHRQTEFRSFCRESLSSAMGSGTSVAVHGARDGVPFQESIPAEWSTAKFTASSEVSELEIRYPYLDEYRDASGKRRVRAMLYRRVITAERDVTYLPAEANEHGIEPKWAEDPERTVKHGLGFCPVAWYAHMKGTVPINVVDGKAIHAKVTDEISQHDIARSQWHRCALYSEPILVEIGVSPGYNPTDVGRPAMVKATEHGGPVSPENPQRGGYLEGGPAQGTARKKGPGYPYQYSSPETKVQLLEYSSDALEAQHKNVSDLRMKLQEAMSVVFLDPENIKFAATTSGKALEAIKQKQLDRCDQIRDDVRGRLLLPAIKLQLRIAQKLGQAYRVPGIREALPVLEKLALDGWHVPSIKLRWGSYFPPDPLEQKTRVETVRAARGRPDEEPYITRRQSVELMSELTGADNVDAVLDELDKEDAARAEEKVARDQARAEAARALRPNGASNGAQPTTIQP